MQEGKVRLATWMPFRQACRELEFFTGMQVSATTVRTTAEQAGQAQVHRQDQQAATIQAECPASPPGPAVQMLSVDGAFIQLVGGEWKEVKTLALGVVGKPRQEDGERVVHTAELSYFSRMSESKEFEKQALVEIHERGVEKAEVVCAVTDGAEWIQKFVDVHRHDAVRILDFAHAMEKVAEVGKTIEEQGLILAFLDQHGEDTSAERKKSRQRKKKQAGEPKQSNQTEPHLVAGYSSMMQPVVSCFGATVEDTASSIVVCETISRLQPCHLHRTEEQKQQQRHIWLSQERILARCPCHLHICLVREVTTLFSACPPSRFTLYCLSHTRMKEPDDYMSYRRVKLMPDDENSAIERCCSRLYCHWGS